MEMAFAIKNLTFTYDKKRPPVINDISFNIQAGTIFGLLGPSVAGKSTIQKILCKLMNNYSGEIAYFGKDLHSFNKQYYENIGVGFEMPVHFSKLTALENMAYFANLYQTKIDYPALLIRLGLGDALNQPVGQFSKGMKVRLNFVRALLNNPEMIFLDEPTNGLDPANARVLKDIILELKASGKTIFITTHLMSDVEELCDQVAFIAGGKLLETASPKALKLKYGERLIRVEYEENNESHLATFPLDKIGDNAEFERILQSTKIVTMHSAETTMDKIFIQIVEQAKNA